jgi:hypothetical protein
VIEFFSVIPAKAGIQRVSAADWIALKASLRAQVFAAPGIQVDSRSWFSWMPDQIRHDGELWTVELIITQIDISVCYDHPLCHVCIKTSPMGEGITEFLFKH